MTSFKKIMWLQLMSHISSLTNGQAIVLLVTGKVVVLLGEFSLSLALLVLQRITKGNLKCLPFAYLRFGKSYSQLLFKNRNSQSYIVLKIPVEIVNW